MTRRGRLTVMGLMGVFGMMGMGIILQGTSVLADVPVSERLDLSQGEDATDFFDAIASGKISVNIRARAEIADIRGLRTSQSYTARTKLGYLTQAYEGLQFMVELEDVRALDDDRYNSTLNGQGARSVVADPEVTELNQAWAQYALPIDGMALAIKAGRQVITFDDQRLIGAVGWRQDDQTFDALKISSDLGVEKLNVTYAYVDQINRIFAEAGDWNSTSHLFNVSYAIDKIGKVSGFAYLLDFDGSSAMNSSQTFGVRLAGKQKIDETFAVNYQTSVAFQQDYGDNPVNYDATYFMVDAGLVVKDIGTFGVGYELLGSDGGAIAFRTPLATGHKFNGFADVFLVTPATGLEDLYFYYKPSNLPFDVKGMLAYHLFGGDTMIESYGSEIDAVLTKKINDYVSVGAKFSYFFTDEPGFAERSRVTFDVTLKF